MAYMGRSWPDRADHRESDGERARRHAPRGSADDHDYQPCAWPGGYCAKYRASAGAICAALDRRYRYWYGRGDPAPCLRAILYYQGARLWHWLGAGYLLRHC